ncbi:MAG: cytochrome c [Chitinophagaceae bacterium]|nr:MAG: cytochrome c [Chitinophagaceae bacterium]
MRLILILWLAACARCYPQAQQLPGKNLFDKHCAICHGKQGDRCRFGAKNLRETNLTGAQLLAVISSGRNRMPAWKTRIPEKNISDIICYIKTFRS